MAQLRVEAVAEALRRCMQASAQCAMPRLA
jgi:hypothetical protein